MPDTRYIALADGEALPVPVGLSEAIERAATTTAHAPGSELIAVPKNFHDRLLIELRAEGFYLVPTIRSTSKEAVSIDLYSLALTRKAAAEQHQKLAADMLFPVVQRDDGEGLQSFDVRDMLRHYLDDPDGGDSAAVERVLERLDMAHEILCQHPPGTVVVPDGVYAVRQVTLGDGTLVTIERGG